jgi:hypothetical protein
MSIIKMQKIKKLIRKLTFNKMFVILASILLLGAGTFAYWLNTNTFESDMSLSASNQEYIRDADAVVEESTSVDDISGTKADNNSQADSKDMPTSPSTNNKSNKNTKVDKYDRNYDPGDYGYTPPEDPSPQFRLILQSPNYGSNAFGFTVAAVDIVNPSEIVEFTQPTWSFGTAGGPSCSQGVYSIGSDTKWGWGCTMYNSATYGEWPVTFSVTAKNVYSKKTTRTVRGVIVYREDQTTYQNILSY